MAVSRAVEARKRAKKLREASLAKSKVKASKVKKKIGKGLKSFGKRLGIGQDKEAWAKGAPERKAKRKASQEKAAEKRAENKAKAKKGPVYSAKKQQAGGYKPLPPKSKKAAKKSDADKSWTKAVKAQKKTGGKTMNELIKARNAAKASGDIAKYAAAQNQINKAYGVKKRHKADAPKKAAPKKPKAPKVATKKPVTPVEAQDAADYAAKVKAKKATPKKDWHTPMADDSRAGVRPPMADSKKVAKPKSIKESKPKKKAGEFEQIKPYPSREDQGPKFDSYAEGGKVESNPYGWPTRDARGRK